MSRRERESRPRAILRAVEENGFVRVRSLVPEGASISQYIGTYNAVRALRDKGLVSVQNLGPDDRGPRSALVVGPPGVKIIRRKEEAS